MGVLEVTMTVKKHKGNIKDYGLSKLKRLANILDIISHFEDKLWTFFWRGKHVGLKIEEEKKKGRIAYER